jgi:cyclic-di-GMP-binding protein
MALKLALLPVDQKTDRAPELDIEKVKAHLAGLPFNEQPAQSARALADELARLNHWKVDPAARWHLLEEYFSAAAGSWTLLDTHYANVAHPMRGAAAEAAEVALAVATGIAMGYKRILADLSRMRLGFGLPKAPTLLIHRCQQCLARILSVSYMSFRPVPPNTWFELHQIYLLARDSGIAHTPFSDQTPGFTPEVAYIQVLLLSLANPYGFLPGQISLALIFLGDYAHLAKLTDTPPVHRMASALAVVPVASDQPPMAARKVDVPEHAVALYLHCYDVVLAINQHVQELEAGTAWPAATVADTITQPQYLNFVERLLREWGVAPTRHEMRSAGNRSVMLCAGLGPIFHAMLELEESRRGKKPAEFEPVPRAQCTVVNQTDGGYSLRLESAQAEVALRVGEVVGLLEARQRRVPVAVVRWLRFDGLSGQTRFGVEVLSTSAELTKVSIPSRGGLELPAITLPPALLTDEHSTLVAPTGVLTSDLELQLGGPADAETVIVTRLVEQTLNFERYEFIPVE